MKTTLKSILKSARFQIIVIALAVTVTMSAAIGGSIAFFNDSKESESVFTAGNVYIELTEAAVKPNANGDLIEDTESARIQGAEINGSGAGVVNNYGVIFPGQTIFKDPTIKNIGNSDAWVAAKVIIEDGAGDIHRLFKYSDEYDDIDIEHLLVGGLLDEYVHVGEWNGIADVCYNDRYAMIQHSDRTSGKYEFYFIMLEPLGKDETVEIFDTLVVNSMFGNSEMYEFRELRVTVQAFAVQKFGFSSCLDAMTNAFTEHFTNATALP